jgi:hypothetical protein
MAQDIRFDNKNNQKKGVSIFASGLISAANASTPDYTLFTLPRAALVTRAYAIVTDAAAAGDTLDVKVGSTVVANEIAISSLGVASGTVTPAYFATGGLVSVVAGDGAALGGAAIFKIVVEYIETEVSDGKYTD